MSIVADVAGCREEAMRATRWQVAMRVLGVIRIHLQYIGSFEAITDTRMDKRPRICAFNGIDQAHDVFS